MPLPNATVWTAHWVLFGVSCCVSGWLLSAVHWLTPLGLLIAIPSTWVITARLCGVGMPRIAKPIRLSGQGHHRPLVWLFLITAALALIGGLLYPPNNYDALNYRIPRTMHWLYQHAWHWIPANSDNVNTRASGFEWMTAPLLAWFHSDRLFFLINLISFLLLPGLVFSVFRQMGVAGRTAHAWMWLLPTGYCFVLQAGSIGNDLPAATFALAAFDFGFRWKSTKSRPCLYLAIAAAGLMTAIKPTTMPLLLPFAVLFFGMWKPLLQRPLVSSILLLAFFTASFLPNAVINYLQCGDWTGAEAEDAALGMVEPMQGIIVNLINAPIQNLSPPVFPLAKHWNDWFYTLFPTSFLDSLTLAFEARAARFALFDFQGEESAGIGIGISLLWLGSLGVAAWLGIRKRKDSPAIPRSYCPLAFTLRHPRFRASILFSLLFGAAILAYFAKTGMNTVARHITPFYPFLLAIPLAAPVQARIVRSKYWRLAAIAAMTSSIGLMVITPSRPLWPAQQAFSTIDPSSSPLIKRATDGYRVYANRANWAAPLRDAIPEDAHLVGFINFFPGAETPLWKPYFSRKLVHITPSQALQPLLDDGLSHVVINTSNFENRMGVAPNLWVTQHAGTIIKRKNIRVLAKQGATEWWVVKLP